MRKAVALLIILVFGFFCFPVLADIEDGTWVFRVKNSNSIYRLKLEEIHDESGEITVTISGFGEELVMWAAIFLNGKIYTADSAESTADGMITYRYQNEHFGESKPEAIVMASQKEGRYHKLLWRNPDAAHLLTEEDVKNLTVTPPGIIGPEWKKTLTLYEPAWRLAFAYGLESPDDLYTPETPEPLNVYVITHDQCEIAINNDGIYPVNQKGIVQPLSLWLKEWKQDIIDESNGVIRFVADPDMADILLVIRVNYLYHGKYNGPGFTAEGFSCKVEWTAHSLSRPGIEFSVSLTKTPPDLVSIAVSKKFWEKPPEFKGTDELSVLTDTVMCWYGYRAAINSSGTGVETARQALIDRGFLKAEPGDVFDADMENAVKLLQMDYGLEETGAIDYATMIALYHDQDEAERVLTDYPASVK